MGWKKLPTWLKGGTIGEIIIIILLISLFILFSEDNARCTFTNPSNPVVCTIQSLTLVPLAILSLSLASFLMPPKIGNFSWTISYIIYNLIVAFILGSLIGLIIGKIKSK